MKISAIQCKKCGDTIFSRATHDYHSCTCGDCFIDGGFDYIRVGYKEEGCYVSKVIDLKVTKKELYDDWNKNKDKFGTIKEKAKKTKKMGP
jgi:hypothetical protein